MTWSSAYNSQPCLQVRVKDVDLERGQLVVRAGKGKKDRVTMLPDRLKAGLQTHYQAGDVPYAAAFVCDASA
jgi:integrase